jgi:hypothetical protein
MTTREQLEAILYGRPPERIPWIPRLQIWYDASRQRGTLPARYAGWGLRAIERDLGMGTPAREGTVFRTELRGVDVHTRREGFDTMTEYVTPFGTVNTRARFSEALAQGGISTAMEVEHMIKGPRDYRPVEHIFQHTEILPTYDAFLAYDAEIGDDGLPMTPAGPDPIYRILRELIGFGAGYYHMVDYPDQFAHLLEVIKEYDARLQQVVLDSPARLVLYGEHFDSLMTPPPLFRKYQLEHLQSFAERLHTRGKKLVGHADADTSRLLGLLKEAGYDVLETFVTAPMVPITLAQARAVLGTEVIIWGGLPSTILCAPVSEAEFEAYMQGLFRTIAPGAAFILGVADNVMAETIFGRLERVSELVRNLGSYPIRP